MVEGREGQSHRWARRAAKIFWIKSNFYFASALESWKEIHLDLCLSHLLEHIPTKSSFLLWFLMIFLLLFSQRPQRCWNIWQFCSTPPNILSVEILVGWPFKTSNVLGSIPTVAVPNPDQPPNHDQPLEKWKCCLNYNLIIVGVSVHPLVVRFPDPLGKSVGEPD